jgi:hypothetical protein
MAEVQEKAGTQSVLAGTHYVISLIQEIFIGVIKTIFPVDNSLDIHRMVCWQACLYPPPLFLSRIYPVYIQALSSTYAIAKRLIFIWFTCLST